MVREFGQETFQRAENAMKADKVTRSVAAETCLATFLTKGIRQTADTFQAAATFFELCQIWGPLDAEIASKIKFAKYHALRIAKAIKAGEDPNASNPVHESEHEVNGVSALDPNDPEVQALSGIPPSHQASAKETSDEQNHMQPTSTTPVLTQSAYPPRNESINRSGPSSPYHNAQN